MTNTVCVIDVRNQCGWHALVLERQGTPVGYVFSRHGMVAIVLRGLVMGQKRYAASLAMTHRVAPYVYAAYSVPNLPLREVLEAPFVSQQGFIGYPEHLDCCRCLFTQ